MSQNTDDAPRADEGLAALHASELAALRALVEEELSLLKESLAKLRAGADAAEAWPTWIWGRETPLSALLKLGQLQMKLIAFEQKQAKPAAADKKKGKQPARPPAMSERYWEVLAHAIDRRQRRQQRRREKNGLEPVAQSVQTDP